MTEDVGGYDFVRPPMLEIKKIGLKNIDRLYMDIEGLDSDVLLDLDLDYFNIPFIRMTSFCIIFQNKEIYRICYW